MKYLRKFNSHSEYLSPKDFPDVSYCDREDEVHYNPFSNKITFTVNDVSFNMIKVEGGTFMMGGDSNSHEVTLTYDYYIGETEVTLELWNAVMNLPPVSTLPTVRFPKTAVSWNDCQTFITRLNTLTDQSFRLPTEAEWEFAARGGNDSRGYTYSGSDNFNDVGTNNITGVATKHENELGIYDMTGNVYEWCYDYYGAAYSNDSVNPLGPSSGLTRVVRSGDPVTARTDAPESSNYLYLGFRLVLGNSSTTLEPSTPIPGPTPGPTPDPNTPSPTTPLMTTTSNNTSYETLNDFLENN